jgi:hypothetical protein
MGTHHKLLIRDGLYDRSWASRLETTALQARADPVVHQVAAAGHACQADLSRWNMVSRLGAWSSVRSFGSG